MPNGPNEWSGGPHSSHLEVNVTAPPAYPFFILAHCLISSLHPRGYGVQRRNIRYTISLQPAPSRVHSLLPADIWAPCCFHSLRGVTPAPESICPRILSLGRMLLGRILPNISFSASPVAYAGEDCFSLIVNRELWRNSEQLVVSNRPALSLPSECLRVPEKQKRLMAWCLEWKSSVLCRLVQSRSFPSVGEGPKDPATKNGN